MKPRWSHTYQSVSELLTAIDSVTPGQLHHRDEWAGCSLAEARRMAIHGWPEGEQEAMKLVESALSLVEREHPRTTFRSFYDVSGSEVDVARHLSGVPESMVEYEPLTISRVGRVVTLCASVTYSGSLSARSVLKRGAAITALAVALERSGHAVEIWGDRTGHPKTGPKQTRVGQTRILIKGAHDTVDPSLIAYVLAHPSMLRRLMFATALVAPADERQAFGWTSTYLGEIPMDPIEDMPEGTIYLPTLCTERDVPEPAALIESTLRRLGLLSE